TLYVLLALLFIITTGFGIYSFGPWRVYVLAAATVVAIAFAVGAAVRPPGELRLAAPRPVAVLLAAGALWGNWGWAAEPRFLPYLHFIEGIVAFAVLLSLPLRRDGSDLAGGLWPAYLAAVTAFYTVVIIGVPSPYIDVWDQMNKAAASLLAGDNPYAVPI